MSTEQSQAWLGSLALHGAAALLLLLFHIASPDPFAQADVVELSWTVPPPVPAFSAAPHGSPVKAKTVPSVSSRGPRLPLLRPGAADEPFPMPAPRKRQDDERETLGPSGNGNHATGQKEGPFAGRSVKTGQDAGTGHGTAAVSGNGGAMGTIAWVGGGTRKKISGNMPEYPPGARVEAQIRLFASITPEGKVASLTPAQKGNMQLEEAAMNAVRSWRFEPLPSSAPRVDQSCFVTFNFKLR